MPVRQEVAPLPPESIPVTGDTIRHIFDSPLVDNTLAPILTYPIYHPLVRGSDILLDLSSIATEPLLLQRKVFSYDPKEKRSEILQGLPDAENGWYPVLSFFIRDNPFGFPYHPDTLHFLNKLRRKGIQAGYEGYPIMAQGGGIGNELKLTLVQPTPYSPGVDDTSMLVRASQDVNNATNLAETKEILNFWGFNMAQITYWLKNKPFEASIDRHSPHLSGADAQKLNAFQFTLTRLKH